MKIHETVGKLKELYPRFKEEATEYLNKARKIETVLGPGTAICYCWFYSVPQRWTALEPRIMKLAEETEYFNLERILKLRYSELKCLFNGIVFHNIISLQFRRFCGAIAKIYGSWEKFGKILKEKDIVALFRELRNESNIRLTFKNLSAMKIIVGQDDNLLIPDTHVGNFLGLTFREITMCRQDPKAFLALIDQCHLITRELKVLGLKDISTAKWSLAVWFSKSKTSASQLLPCIQ